MTPAGKPSSANDAAPAGTEVANDNEQAANPTIIDLPVEISEECRRRLVEVLARILVRRTLDPAIAPHAFDE